mmetsp:Transcript_4740/g.13623  ORF Transcript_4740/g.13623 Transcript_4740/m.13623 type:complete len:98 (+) Transcript_4740:847-1140(+)
MGRHAQPQSPALPQRAVLETAVLVAQFPQVALMEGQQQQQQQHLVGTDKVLSLNHSLRLPLHLRLGWGLHLHYQLTSAMKSLPWTESRCISPGVVLL